ncbi:MAG: VOC family protein [Pseudomonadota bacterium]
MQPDPSPYTPANFTVWMEIPVSDLEKAMQFYSAVTRGALDLQTTGPNPIAVFRTTDPDEGIAGHLYEGRPASEGGGPTVHIAADGTLEEIIARIWDAGGRVVSPPIEIPAGRFAYAVDPDGNSVGFFEAKAA